jgi:hypothetical protein
MPDERPCGRMNNSDRQFLDGVGLMAIGWALILWVALA